YRREGKRAAPLHFTDINATMHARNVYNSSLIARRDLRCVRALRTSPVDAFQQHRQLRAAQVHHAALGLRPYKATTLEPLREQAQSITIPPQQLHPIAPPAAKDEQLTGERIFRQLHLYDRSQPVKALAHVGRAARDPDASFRGQANHRAHSSATTRSSSSRANSPRRRTHFCAPRSISTHSSTVLRTDRAGVDTFFPTFTGTSAVRLSRKPF